MTPPPNTPARILPFVPRGGLTFGIFPGGVVETHQELSTGRPDVPLQVNEALDRLQCGRNLFIRTYLRFTGSDADIKLQNMPTPDQMSRYAQNGRKLDLVLSNWDPTGDMQRWIAFIKNAVECYGSKAQNIQICEEPNLYDYPGDGRFGHSVQAIITGVPAAREALRQHNLRAAVGFNAVPATVRDDGFWRGLAGQMNERFLNALDYVALNLYVDVGEPLRTEVEEAVEKPLAEFREVTLKSAGIPAVVPLHISENGWPTGPNRFYTRQAEILRRIVTRVYDLRSRMNINQFALFALRDADTGNPDPGKQFGLMRDDYTPKPAFDVYRQLITEFGD